LVNQSLTIQDSALEPSAFGLAPADDRVYIVPVNSLIPLRFLDEGTS
jgi:hypothetical protein